MINFLGKLQKEILYPLAVGIKVGAKAAYRAHQGSKDPNKIIICTYTPTTDGRQNLSLNSLNGENLSHHSKEFAYKNVKHKLRELKAAVEDFRRLQKDTRRATLAAQNKQIHEDLNEAVSAEPKPQDKIQVDEYLEGINQEESMRSFEEQATKDSSETEAEFELESLTDEVRKCSRRNSERNEL